jgi:hypothetical protein
MYNIAVVGTYLQLGRKDRYTHELTKNMLILILCTVVESAVALTEGVLLPRRIGKNFTRKVLVSTRYKLYRI